MQKRGEVQKGFLLILLVIISVAILGTYLQNDGTGYASTSITTKPPCECNYGDQKTIISNVICPYGGEDGQKRCVYNCREEKDSNCKLTRVSQSTNNNPDGTIETTERLMTGEWWEIYCETTCKSDSTKRRR